MKLFITIMFWYLLVGFVFYLLQLVYKKFPYQDTTTIGNQVFKIIFSGILALWAGILLFGLGWLK